MPNELWMYILIVSMAGTLSIFLCVFALLKIKDAPGALYYVLLTLLSAIFTFAYAFELASKSLEQIKFWLTIEYLALPFIPVCILLMCVDYVGQKLKPWIYYVMFVIPIITIFLHNTTELHHLYYKSMELRSDTPFAIIKLEGGPWFYVHSSFVFLCIMMSVIVLLMQLKKSLFRFRMQILMMVAGLIVPLIATYFYLNEMSPYGIDLGPVSMSISFIFHGAAILSFQMFNVAPIARDKVFESMNEGVIVLSQNNVIIDYNDAMLTTIPELNASVIGKSVTDVLEGNQELKEIIFRERPSHYVLSKNGEIRHYDILFSPVLNKNNQSIGQIINFSDVTDWVKMQETLQLLASMDGLTQVYNRTFFMKKSEEAFETLINTGGCVSVIMFDIDHFKRVNDTFGHEAGDIVLSQVALMAKECLRPTDMMGRYGGEEFILYLPKTLIFEANEIANTILTKVFESSMYVHDQEINVTLSFGISGAHIEAGDQEHSLPALMRQADQALYGAKMNGRNCVQLFGETLEYAR